MVAGYEEAFQPAGFSAAPRLDSLSVTLLEFLRFIHPLMRKKKKPKKSTIRVHIGFSTNNFFFLPGSHTINRERVADVETTATEC